MASMERTQPGVWSKTCPRCNNSFEVVAGTWEVARTAFLKYFYPHNGGRTADLLNAHCKQCHGDRTHGRKGNGLKQEDMLTAQNGLCFLCDSPITFDNRTAVLDHDHNNGAIRKVLCTKCNTMMHGVDKDDWLKRAVAYRDTFK